MKHLIILIICFFALLEVKAQENEIYFVNASAGLIIRNEPDLNSDRIGKLPYGKTVELIQETNLEQQLIANGDTINGVWVKIKYNNFPFICSESDLDPGEWNLQGYVFGEYIEKLNKARIEITDLDSLHFYELYKKPEVYKPVKIDSIEEVKRILVDKVKWKDIEYLGPAIVELKLENGQILRGNHEANDFGFVAYYPSEKIILFEGGHSSDYSISIKTGETLETVGNPEYILESPNKKLRLNGWFPGQECSSYFFQEKSGDNYKYLIDFGWGSIYGDDLCYFDKFCWINDVEFICSFKDYSEDSYSGVEKYFKSKIIH